MTPKTERFEMRLPPGLMERVDAFRSGEADVPSRAEAVRRLLEKALNQDAGELKPTQMERLMLWMQASTLKILSKQPGADAEAETADLVLQTLYGGHFWALNWEMTGVLHNETTPIDQVRFVSNVLDMWQFVERGVASLSNDGRNRLEKEAGIWGKDPKFRGFDGNYEGEMMSIARFLIEDLKRFQQLKGHELNSHYPAVDDYRSMLQKFENIRSNLIGREMSVEELVQVLKREEQ